MTPDDFRQMALGLPEVEERSHMAHPDFRVGGKIFATLSYPDQGTAMVKLSPEDQRLYLQMDPETFFPAAGAWGRAGCTMVRLQSADADQVSEAMKLAWRLLAQKKRAPRKKKA